MDLTIQNIRHLITQARMDQDIDAAQRLLRQLRRHRPDDPHIKDLHALIGFLKSKRGSGDSQMREAFKKAGYNA